METEKELDNENQLVTVILATLVNKLTSKNVYYTAQ
jgi:hypothetical protein